MAKTVFFGGLVSVLFGGITLLYGIPAFFFFLLHGLFGKRLISDKRLMDWLESYSRHWLSVTRAIVLAVHHVDIRGAPAATLDRNRSYLILCNHQTWSDVPVLIHVLWGQVPFIRFVAKKELRYLPVLGPFMEKLGCPLIARTKGDGKKRNGYVTAIREGMRKMEGRPASLCIFPEGTRFTEEKKTIQNSPFQNLLRPKTGAVWEALQSRKSRFDSVLDVTIRYRGKLPTFYDLLSGRLPAIDVRIRQLAAPQDDPASWLEEVWREKDAVLSGEESR